MTISSYSYCAAAPLLHLVLRPIFPSPLRARKKSGGCRGSRRNCASGRAATIMVNGQPHCWRNEQEDDAARYPPNYPTPSRAGSSWLTPQRAIWCSASRSRASWTARRPTTAALASATCSAPTSPRRWCAEGSREIAPGTAAGGIGMPSCGLWTAAPRSRRRTSCRGIAGRGDRRVACCSRLAVPRLPGSNGYGSPAAAHLYADHSAGRLSRFQACRSPAANHLLARADAPGYTP
jgi:hypothetical protein